MIEHFERKTIKQEFLNGLIENRTEKCVNNKGTDSDFEDSIRYKSYMDCFIDGLVEGKLKWHDLRKNPNDLPHDETQVLIVNNFDNVQYYLGYFDNFHSIWFSERALRLFDVIA